MMVTLFPSMLTEYPAFLAEVSHAEAYLEVTQEITTLVIISPSIVEMVVVLLVYTLK